MSRLIRTALFAALAACAGSCAKTDYAHLYRSSEKAPSYSADDIQALKYLGPTFSDQGVNFGVYSQRASRIELLLFDDPESNLPARVFQLTRFGDVWNVYVEGVGLGQYYGYRAWGPNWTFDANWSPGSILGFQADVDGSGNRFNPNKLLLDPYCKAVHRDHDWSKGSTASGDLKRTEVDYAAASKSVIAQSTYVWSQGEATWRQNRTNPTWSGHQWHDLVIYETHPKGFTMSTASAVNHPGTFLGIAEKADYLADLGVNAVELLPIFQKPLDGGYWGYDTLLFFVPNFRYAFNHDTPSSVMDEFKYMVDQLHQRNIEVILDIVYNHTGEGGLWRDKIQLEGQSADPSNDYGLINLDPKEVAGLYSYRGLDNWSYYALSADNQTYWNNTGVGQETRPNIAPMRNLILDSLHYWASEMHVDGFRFDLAPILGEQDMNYNQNYLASDPTQSVVQDIIDDPTLQQYNTRIIAEPWSLAYYGEGRFPTSSTEPCQAGSTNCDAWYEWNGQFRDVWREFLNIDTWPLNGQEGSIDLGNALTGSSNLYAWNGRRPYHSINFTNIHDGFTMYDLFSYNQKQNLCGPLNQICCQNPSSPFCDPTSGENNNRSRDWRCPNPYGVYCPTSGATDGQSDEPFKRQQMRNLFTAMMVSQGTPMLLGGDEWMRTQYGNNNAYSDSADNEFNWYQWGSWQPDPAKNRMHDFVRALVKFRRSHTYAFAPDAYGGGDAFSWSDENGNPPNWSSRHLMMHYTDATQGPPLAILINMEPNGVSFRLPPGNWVRLIDTQGFFDANSFFSENPSADPNTSQNATVDNPVPAPGSSYGVPSHSIVVLQQQ